MKEKKSIDELNLHPWNIGYMPKYAEIMISTDVFEYHVYVKSQ